MSVSVLTAVTGARWEADVVSELAGAEHGIHVVRRCVDLAELLAAAAAGTAQAALLSAELRRLDRDAITRLAAAAVAVVGLVNSGDADAERRLHQLGVGHVLAADAGARTISAAVLEAVDALAPDSRAADAYANPGAALADFGAAADPRGPGAAGEPAPEAGTLGRLVVVWGPAGAPGRSTLALGLADEAARLGVSSLLVDADVYGGVLAQMLGILDESPGLAAATRLAGSGALDVGSLAKVSWSVGPMLRVLTGITRAERWPELDGGSVEAVLDVARSLARFIVVDVGFCIESDEEISYDTMAPRRNAVTLIALQAADTVVCVGGADPVALQRLVRALGELRDVAPDVTPTVVINRLRKRVIPGNPRVEVATALRRYAGVESPTFLPDDATATDSALAVGKTLAEVAGGSPLRAGIVGLARSLAGVPEGRRRRRH